MDQITQPATPSVAPPPGGSYDISGAINAGVSPTDITSFLSDHPEALPHYDVKGAIAAGVSPDDVVSFLNGKAGNLAAAQAGSPKNFDISGALGAGYSSKEITDYLTANPHPGLKFDVAGALKAGYSPDEVIDHINGTSGGVLQGAPVIAPIARGAAHALSGVADLATDAGFTGVGSAIRGRINQEDLQAPTAGGSLVSDLKGGRIGAALGELPSAALEQAPTLLPTLAAGALTGGSSLLASAALRAGTASILSGLTNGDAVARSRAANDGRSTPSTAELLQGVFGAGAAGAAGSVGLGGTGAGLSGALKGLATHTAADAVAPELQALAGSVGTDKGAQNASGADMTASALTGAVTRGAMAGPEAASTAYTALSPAARQATLRASYGKMGAEDQSNAAITAAAGNALNQASAANGKALSTPEAARAAIGDLSNNVYGLMGALGHQGLIDGNDGKTIGAALRAAQSPNDNLTAQHLQDIKALQLDPDTEQALTGGLQTIDRLSGSLQATSAGPIQSALTEAAGPLGGALVGGVSGGPVGAVTGAILGRAARSALQPVLGGLGAKLDGLLGTAKPSLVLDAHKAAALLSAAGQPVPDTRADLMGAIGASHEAFAQQSRILGLQPVAGDATASPQEATHNPPASFDAMAAQQRQDEAAVQPAGRGGPNTPAVSPGATQGGSPVSAAGAGASAASQGSGVVPGAAARPGDYDPTAALGGLNGDAMAQAQRLPTWVYALGSNLEDALQRSGQARPVNMMAEVHGALDDLQSAGMLSPEMVDALKGHQGRVVPLVYNLARNALLLRQGIDRRTIEAQQPAATTMPVQQVAAE